MHQRRGKLPRLIPYLLLIIFPETSVLEWLSFSAERQTAGR